MSWSKIRYERIEDQYYVLYLGDKRLGTIKHMDDKKWHALDLARRKGFSHTRGEAAEWLRKSDVEALNAKPIT